MKDEYRKDAAKPEDKKNFIDITAEIEKAEGEIETIDQQIKDAKEEQVQLRYDFNQLHEKLIREGDLMSIDRLHALESERDAQRQKLDEAQDGLKDLY